MRDPNRIPLMLDELREIWEKQPDLRLGQLIEIVRMAANEHYCHLFDVEDEKMQVGMKRFKESQNDR